MILSGAKLLLLLLLALGQCGSSEQDKDPAVELLYKKSTIPAALGSSVTLTCEAEYSLALCGLVHVVWCQVLGQQLTELTASGRYMTTVSEMERQDGKRLRHVSTEILSLTPEDFGTFQCIAVCEEGEKARGHYVRIKVNG